MKLGNSFTSILIVLLLATALGCTNSKKKETLPYLGRSEIVTSEKNGVKKIDTLYHRIPNFSFVDQDSSVITEATFENKIYVADFFFTSCLTICPTMKGQMLRIYDAYEEDEEVALLSHSIDPEYDTVALLHDYAAKLGVESKKWHMVTGDKDKIFEIAGKSYMVSAAEDKSAEDGFIHSGAFMLIDKDRHVRGKYDGTKPEQVDQLIKDIKKLKQEYATQQ